MIGTTVAVLSRVGLIQARDDLASFLLEELLLSTMFLEFSSALNEKIWQSYPPCV
jgi:hypothetical protein